jgi:hypothetical protein
MLDGSFLFSSRQVIQFQTGKCLLKSSVILVMSGIGTLRLCLFLWKDCEGGEKD